MRQNKLKLFIMLITLSFSLCGCVPAIAGGVLFKCGWDLKEAKAEFNNAMIDIVDSVSGTTGSMRGQVRETTQEAVDNNGFFGNGLGTNFNNWKHKFFSWVGGEDCHLAKTSEEALNTSFQNDTKAQATAQERNSTATNENKESNGLIFTAIIIAVALLILFILLSLLKRPAHAVQPRVITIQQPAPAPSPPVVSGDLNVNYSHRLRALCDKHHKDYNAVLQSFGGDERKAVESMQTL